jgi:hypothetical protein
MNHDSARATLDCSHSATAQDPTTRGEKRALQFCREQTAAAPNSEAANRLSPVIARIWTDDCRADSVNTRTHKSCGKTEIL